MHGHKKSTTEADALGDAVGVVSYASPIADDIVSARWVARRMLTAAAQADDLRHECEPNADLGDALGYAAEQFRWAVALYDGWVALEEDTGAGRQRDGDLTDIADLFVAGRGSIRDLAAAVRRGDYLAAPRDAEGFLLLT